MFYTFLLRLAIHKLPALEKRLPNFHHIMFRSSFVVPELQLALGLWVVEQQALRSVVVESYSSSSHPSYTLQMRRFPIQRH
jgi:hypothetical protein